MVSMNQDFCVEIGRIKLLFLSVMEQDIVVISLSKLCRSIGYCWKMTQARLRMSHLQAMIQITNQLSGNFGLFLVIPRMCWMRRQQ